MKMTIAWLLPLTFLLVTGKTTAQDYTNVQFDLDDVICKEQQRAQGLIDFSKSRNFAADQTDIYYQDMHWEIDPAINYIKGVITYYFKSRMDNLSNLILDLSDALHVNSIQRGSQPLTYTHGADQILTIDLGKQLNAGESDTLTISYEGTPPSNGFGSFVQSTHDNVPVIWTLSEPYGVRDWWPGKQDLVDKVDSIDTYITTPPGQLAAGNGKLISITEENGKLVHHWRHRHPIASYLIALAVTDYSAYTDKLPLANGDTIPILNYVYPENLAAAQAQTVSSLQIMGLYNELFGLYPFADEKYGHAQFGWGGGMEHQTMTFLVSFGYGLIAHEMAHQWFGDKVTCGSWAEIWLNEGFASYLTALTYERFSHDTYWPQWKSSTINSSTSQPGGSVYVNDTTSVDRIFSGRLSYNKASYVLHMLRWVTGDDAFFQACRDYLDNAGTAYDFGSTAELQGYMEAHSGVNLDEFFADWYYGQGFPSYNLKWLQQSDSLIVWINQTQSHPSVSYFEMPVPVWYYHNGNPEQAVLQNTTQDQRFAVYVGDSHVDSLRFDPDQWILSKNNTVTALISSTETPADNPQIRITPNPASDMLEISGDESITQIDFITAQGQNIRREVNHGLVEVADLAPGYYTALLLDSGNQRKAVRPMMILH